MDTYILKATLGEFDLTEGEVLAKDSKKLVAIVPIDKEALCEEVLQLSFADLRNAMLGKLKEDGILPSSEMGDSLL